jgi:hypothetical protein
MTGATRESALAALPLATAQALAFLQLREDPIYYRIPPTQQVDLVAAALGDGYALADQQRAQGFSHPWRIAQRLGVSVRESTEDASFGTTVVCAEYYTRQREIVLYTRVIERVQGMADDLLHGAAVSGAPCDVRAAYLAHELYHHLDCLRGPDSIARRHRVCLLRIGRLRWTSGVSSLAEIAAGAFAQRLLDLDFHAKLLDLCVLLDRHTPAAQRFVQKLAEHRPVLPALCGVPA